MQALPATVYDEAQVEKVYLANLSLACRKLKELPVYCGTRPAVKGLSGWVYEQTIQYCIRRELKARKIKAEITEQAQLRPHVMTDILAGKIAIEVKSLGLFERGAVAKYAGYAATADAKGLRFLFITRLGGCRTYRRGISRALGRRNVFLLDTKGDWKRLIGRLLELLRAQRVSPG